MPRFPRPSLLAWLGLIAFAAGWIALVDARQIANLRRAGADAPAAVRDDASVTGYARGARNLILPPNRAESQQWIIEVQKMLATGGWGAPRGDFDNAPEGRELPLRAPYRWWLRGVATAERALTGAPSGIAVEQAALHADPALHLLLCVSGGLLVAWRFGFPAGGFFALGVALLFGPTRTFAPGRPEAQALWLATGLAALLLGLCGGQSGLKGRPMPGWFIAAGAATGLGLWIDTGSTLVLLAAGAIGFIAALLLLPSARRDDFPIFPWRGWAASGVVVAGAGWWLEGKIPGAGLAQNHPWLWLAWFGLAETLVQVSAWRRGAARGPQRLALGVGLLALVGAVGWRLQQGGLGSEFGPGTPAFTSADTFLGWLHEEGLGLRQGSLLIALLLIPAALWWRQRPDSTRFLAVVSLGTALPLLILAATAVRWWELLTLALLVVLVVVIAGAENAGKPARWCTAIAALMGVAWLASWPKSNQGGALAPAEAHALVERDLAQGLAARAEAGAVALAPPDLAGALCYYGGFRVIGSPYPGNERGRALTERIAAAASPDEAQSLVQSRYIHYLVLPSWDDTLERFAQASAREPAKTLVALLRTWLPPRWLHPVPYLAPVIPGLEQTSVAVFEVVEPQENTVALSRLADYFVESGQLDLATAVADSLATAFVGDTGGLIARARVALARSDGPALARLMPELLPAVADGKDEDLSWERRAQLALVLAQTKHADLAQAQVKFCVQEADEERLRQLGPVSLYHLLRLSRVYRIDFADPRLRAYGLGLLPPEFQAQLQP